MTDAVKINLMTARQTFQKNIKHLRESQDLTMADVAIDLEINDKRYRAWESGKGTPAYDLLVKVCQYFQISIDTMLTTDMTCPES